MDCINRYQVLCFEQVLRLHEVMEGVVQVHGRGNFPTLNITLKNLVAAVNKKLINEGIAVRDIRLNGGAASYIFGTEEIPSYNDVDLIFGVDLSNSVSSNHTELQRIKHCVLSCLMDFLPEEVNRRNMSSCSMKEAYVQKLVKVCSDGGDKWSLISLSNNRGRNVELKFVDKMKRQFEFSVDSFQIIMNSLIKFYEVSTAAMSESFYPTVVAESVFGDFSQAWLHLTKKLIATRNPEEIRGGGLLKYCCLLTRGYLPAEDVDINAMQRYMCSRFFIDFSDLKQQRQKLECYLDNHFSEDESLKHEYLITLYRVVDQSTICLMGHERRQTLNLIHQLACQVLLEQERKAYTKNLEMQHFDQLNNLTIDQVYYGPFQRFNGQYLSPNLFPVHGTSCEICPQTFLQCS